MNNIQQNLDKSNSSKFQSGFQKYSQNYSFHFQEYAFVNNSCNPQMCLPIRVVAQPPFIISNQEISFLQPTYLSIHQMALSQQNEFIQKRVEKARKTSFQVIPDDYRTSKKLLDETPQNKIKNKKISKHTTTTKQKATRRSTDEQYNPLKRIVNPSKKKTQLNQDRNVIPNITNHVFNFIRKKEKSGYLIQRIFNKQPHPEQYTIQNFYQYQAIRKDQSTHHNSADNLSSLKHMHGVSRLVWSYDQCVFYNKVSRILAEHFLKQEAIFIILTSKKMLTKKWKSHFQGLRRLKKIFKKKLQQ